MREYKELTVTGQSTGQISANQFCKRKWGMGLARSANWNFIWHLWSICGRADLTVRWWYF